MTAKTLDDAIAQNHAALDAMVKGDSTAYVAMLSESDDVTWGNPFGPFARGRNGVEATLAAAASRMQDGKAGEFEHVATYHAEDLAVVVQVEHGESRFEGAEALSSSTLLDPPRHQRLPARGRRLEARAPARRPHHHTAPAGSGERAR